MQELGKLRGGVDHDMFFVHFRSPSCFCDFDFSEKASMSFAARKSWDHFHELSDQGIAVSCGSADMAIG